MVPDRLSNPDALVIATREGFIASSRDDWRATYLRYPDHLSIATTKALHDAALVLHFTFDILHFAVILFSISAEQHE